MLSEVCVAKSPSRKPLEPTGASEDEEEAVPPLGNPAVLCRDTGGSPEPVVALKVASLWACQCEEVSSPSCRSPRGGWRTTRLIREANSFAVSGRPLSGGGRGVVACRFGWAAFPDGAPRASLAPAAVSECWGVPGLLPAGPDLLPAPLLAVFLTTLDGFCGVEDAISGERRSSRSRVRAGAGPEDSDTPSRWGRPMEGAGGDTRRPARRDARWAVGGRMGAIKRF